MHAVIVICFVASLAGALGQEQVRLKATDPKAAGEAASHKRPLASAAWWGFNPEDSTEAVQAAINSGAKKVVIPYMGEPWITRPLKLASQQEILFEPGVLVLAKKGEFQGAGDSLFTAVGVSNLVLRGYGATLRMHKRDYQNPPYTKAEWRMGIALRGCRHVLVEGLRVESSGGDGFYVDGGGEFAWSEDITIRNCVAYDNHRQGLSVVSAMGLLVEDCAFANTWGTAPEAGIDLEPDTEKQRLVNCVIRNCLFENNNGNEILIYLKPLSTNSQPVSIRFEDCLVRMTDARQAPPELGPKGGIQGVAGIAVGAIRDNGPKGQIEFVDCVTENTGKESARVYDKSATSTRVRFVGCSFRNPWTAPYPEDGGPRVPIILNLRKPENTERLGGLDFEDCYVYDRAPRPAVRLEEDRGEFGLYDVHGNIIVKGVSTPSLKLGSKLQDVDLKVTAASK